MNLGAPEILIALLVIALLFGGAKLPKLARSLGSAKGELEKGMKEGEKLSEEAKKDASPSDKRARPTSPDGGILSGDRQARRATSRSARATSPRRLETLAESSRLW